ncbi:uroporphyrinogen-III decarboxylase-like protein [Candidatus Bathyarchaeota archaeon]|nr:MAG: uroporphyrinogen-III decarboxylase-like protein [Candidatus Bathyarchaeota archaeon]
MFDVKHNFDRLIEVLWNEEPDRLPFYEHLVDNEVIEAITGEPVTKLEIYDPGIARLKEEGPKIMRRVRRFAKALIKFYRGMGYDYVPFEAPLRIVRTNIREGTDIAQLSRGIRTWVDETKGTIETREDFEKYPWPDPEEAADLTIIEEICKMLPEDMGLVSGVAGGVFEHVAWIMGLRPFSIALYRDPKLIEDMFNMVGKLILETDKRIVEIEEVGVLRMGDDLGYKSGTMISREQLRRYVFPWQKKCVDLAHKHGKPFILHSCGNLEKIMEALIEYVRIDARHSFQDNITPVTEAKKKYGDRIAILGGIDVDKLCRLPVDELRKYVAKTISECARDGGYALGSGNSITNYMKIENYKAMLEVGLRLGKYPLRRR